jgi:hypothetical protein
VTQFAKRRRRNKSENIQNNGRGSKCDTAWCVLNTNVSKWVNAPKMERGKNKFVLRRGVAIRKDLLETIASYSTRARTRPVMTEGGFS